MTYEPLFYYTASEHDYAWASSRGILVPNGMNRQGDPTSVLLTTLEPSLGASNIYRCLERQLLEEPEFWVEVAPSIGAAREHDAPYIVRFASRDPVQVKSSGSLVERAQASFDPMRVLAQHELL